MPRSSGSFFIGRDDGGLIGRSYLARKSTSRPSQAPCSSNSQGNGRVERRREFVDAVSGLQFGECDAGSMTIALHAAELTAALAASQFRLRVIGLDSDILKSARRQRIPQSLGILNRDELVENGSFAVVTDCDDAELLVFLRAHVIEQSVLGRSSVPLSIRGTEFAAAHGVPLGAWRSHGPF
jgi:hypothetical protein